MLKANFMTAEQVAKSIKDHTTICNTGMSLACVSESILKAIEKRFLSTQSPAHLTLLHSCGQGDRIDGILHLAHEGLVERIIGAHWGLLPRWMEMISNNQVEAYCLPQGQIAQLYRSMACGLPGKLSKVGLGTFVDPRLEGGKMNDRTRNLPDLVEIVHVRGEEYLFFNQIPIDYCIIRGSECDEQGNLTVTDEAMKVEILPAVLATKRYHGKVFAQVKRVVQNGSINPQNVAVPGVFIDGIVVCEEPFIDHRQTSSWYFDPTYSGQFRAPDSSIEPLALNNRKFIGRRAAMELYPGAVVNLGTGIPNDVLGRIVAEEEVAEEIMLTVESGIYGGVQAGGVDFGIGRNICAMIAHHEQMDYYNGAGVDITFMGAGELDEQGNVNATKMGARCTGAGGFIDITQNAKKVVFCATFTAVGAQIAFESERVRILREGKIKKMVKRVGQISFNGLLAREKGQKVIFVTERAVFSLEKEGVVLTEIAPGIDLKNDVLSQMEFTPIISPKLKTMDARLFLPARFGLREMLFS